MQTAKQLFESELHKPNVSFSRPDAHGLYKLRVASTELTIFIENIARDYARDGGPSDFNNTHVEIRFRNVQ